MRMAASERIGDGKKPVRARLLLAGCAAFVAVVLAAPPAITQPAPVKGEISASVSGGYARLIFDLAEEVEADVRTSNGILIVSFKTPVAVNVDRLSASAPGYVSVARVDPDGRGVRLGLSRKVMVNAMAAGEKLFVDLLPDNWTGMKPGLPQDVVDALARRVREAERKAKEQKALQRAQSTLPIRVRVGQQPTFTRYVFDLPDLIAVAIDRGEQHLDLTFTSPLKFDLADVAATLPPGVTAADAETEGERVRVRFSLSEPVETRTFREGNSYVVDFSRPDTARKQDAAGHVRPDDLGALIETAGPTPPPAPSPSPGGQAPSPAGADQSAEQDGLRSTEAVQDRPGPAAEEAHAAPAQDRSAASSTTAAKSEAPPQQAVSTAPSAGAASAISNGAGASLTVRKDADALHIAAHFPAETPAAVFRRGDVLWLVFDTDVKLDIGPLKEIGAGIRDVTSMTADGLQAVRLRLERPRLVDVSYENAGWTITLGPERVGPQRSLSASRVMVGSPRAGVTIDMEGPARLHRLADPDAGDVLWVVTARGPVRGMVKPQDFLEFRVLASMQGGVLQPLADDLTVELVQNRLIVGRPDGLTLSAAAPGLKSKKGHYIPSVLDVPSWSANRDAAFGERRDELTTGSADAAPNERQAVRLELARFYLAQYMPAEAKGVLDLVLAEPGPDAADAVLLRGVASTLIERPQDALRDLSDPLVAHRQEALLWKGVVLSALGKWKEAREGFRTSTTALGLLPPELQAVVLLAMADAAVAVGDIGDATSQLHELDSVGVPPRLRPQADLLNARLTESMGRDAEAVAGYRAAADQRDRRVAAQGRLNLVRLREKLGEMKRDEVVAELETLTTIWRGDETEVEALQLLSRFYIEDARYRDAFAAMRVALATQPNSEFARRMQDDAAGVFDTLFLAGKADALEPIEALSLFYDFRELTPVGRRGDEMIRRLADRLTSVDLLDQAAELLQHQVDHRLQGAARAQVATRLAMVYLMNRKIGAGLQALRATRMAGLSEELRNERLLIEARLLSDSGRHDLAIELIGNIKGRAAQRLRGDVYWAARRWREAGEQIELGLGDAWQRFEPLDELQRADVIRGGMAYALARDDLGLGRFRDRFAGKIDSGPDRRAFEVVTSAAGAGSAEFRDVARMIASAGTLEAFLRDLRADYPGTRALPDEGRPPRIETTPAAAPKQAAAAGPRLAAR